MTDSIVVELIEEDLLQTNNEITESTTTAYLETISIDPEEAVAINSETTDVIVDIISNLIKGPPGPPGPSSSLFQAIAGTDLIAYKLAALDQNANLVYCSSNNLQHAGKVLGILNNSALAGDYCQVTSDNIITNPGWNWITQQNLFVGQNGDISTVPSGLFSQRIGWAASPTSIFVQIGTATLR